MPFLRSLATFILSTIFVISIFTAITSYTLGNLIQKDSLKDFIKSEIGTEFINKQCQENCNQNTDYKDACIQLCITELSNQTQMSVDKTVDEIYQQKLFNITLNEISFFLSQYIVFIIIGIFSGILLLIASKTPFLTLGKDFISISISLFISSVTPQMVIASINLPFNLGQAVRDYLSSGFNQQINYGIILLIIGIILVVINYLLKRIKTTKEKRKK